MLTDVPSVYLRFGTKDQEPLRKLSAEEAAAYLKTGEFPPGSMGPKVRAAIRFLEGGGSRVIITDLDGLELALEGAAGTSIIP